MEEFPALTPKQELFVEEYLQRMNATQAAIAAGYSKRSAQQQGSRLLLNDVILARLRERLDEAAADADEVLRKLTDHARGSMADFMTIDKDGQMALDFRRAQRLNKLHLVKRFKHEHETRTFGSGDNAAVIVKDTYEVELYDAQAALHLLGKHHRLLDRLLEHDWEQEFKNAGLDPAEEFELMVRKISDGMRRAEQQRNDDEGDDL